ncbi:MAG: hypothetical protein L6R40_005493 [Gallowayella cf. fulva]|nr:MAG: hypothetical protein L6R40_005493 [Xanthomendoza cf. fulva]
MASEHVLRLPRTDSPGDYILLNASSNGASPLDFQLLATEGTEPYVKTRKPSLNPLISSMYKLTDLRTVKHSRISKYRSKHNHLSQSQWETLVRSTLLQERTPKSEDTEAEDPLKDLELVASITNSKLTITFRKAISGIHQKLGEFSLSPDPNQSINTLDWASTAVLRAESLESDAETLRRKLAQQIEIAQKLNQQLEELIQAKQEHENALLEKCAVLINEKKKKIRDQQRLLAAAKVDPRKLKAVRAARRPSAPSTAMAKPSRTGKRKASAPAASSEDEDDGFEDNKKIAEDQQPDSEDVTPRHSDLDETEDEIESADPDAVSAPPTAKGKVTEKAEVNGGLGFGMDEDKDLAIELPPKRELPFEKDKGDAAPAAGGADGVEDTRMVDDEETDDDEL